MERIQTGITGLDNLLKGGIPKGANILVSGGAGTGKTILSTQFLYQGAKKYKEPGIYVTFETNTRNVAWNIESFSWDIRPLQDAGLFKIYKLNLTSRKPDVVEQQIDSEFRLLSQMIAENNIKRLVVDSTTAFGAWINDEARLRGFLYDFGDKLKTLDCTTIITSEVRGSDPHEFSAFGVEEFVSDGVVMLYFTPPNRAVFVRKMRGTNHSKRLHPLDIGAKGIGINDKDEVLWQSILGKS